MQSVGAPLDSVLGLGVSSDSKSQSVLPDGQRHAVCSCCSDLHCLHPLKLLHLPLDILRMPCHLAFASGTILEKVDTLLVFFRGNPKTILHPQENSFIPFRIPRGWHSLLESDDDDDDDDDDCG